MGGDPGPLPGAVHGLPPALVGSWAHLSREKMAA